MTQKAHDATAAFELAVASREQPTFLLRLFIAGNTPRSQRAILNLRALCEEHFPGRHDVEVIDVYQQPALAREHQILVVPTLIRDAPGPSRRVVGDLSNTEVVLAALRNAVPSPLHASKNDPAKKETKRRR